MAKLRGWETHEKSAHHKKFTDEELIVDDVAADDPIKEEEPPVDDIDESAPLIDDSSLLLEAETQEDTELHLDLLANFSDLDRNTLSIVALGQPENGTVTLQADGTVLYVPNEDFSGADSFSYTIAVGNPTTVEAVAELTVVAVADEPILEAPASLSATAGETIVLELAAMLTDLDGSETLTVIVEQLPAGATLSAGIDQGDGSWALSGGDLDGLQLILSSDVVGYHDIIVTAIATESSNGDTASVSQTIELSVAPAAADEDEQDTVADDGPVVTIVGTSSDDVFYAAAGNQFIRGESGVDTVVYKGIIEDYEIIKNDNGTMTVRALVTDEGTDTLHNVESIRFADATYDAVRGLVLADGETLEGRALVNGDGSATIIGNSGDNTLVGGFRDTLFRGEKGYDTVVYPGNKDDYEITKNDNGTVTVRALASDEGTDTLHSIELVRFADQDLVLVELKSSGSTSDSTSSGSTSSGSTSVALVKPDPMLQQSQPDDIVGLRLVNTKGSESQDGFLTFGHVFAKGDLSPDSGLVARVDGVDIPVQIDVKATHADGSVRHAVLTIQAPVLAPGAEVDIMLARAKPASEAALDPMGLLDSYDLQLKLVIYEADGTQSTHVIDAASMIAEAFSAGQVKYWLSGPMATEFSVSTAIDEVLDARFDVRVYADGTVRTDVIVSNDNTYGEVAPRTVVYDVEITQGGETQFRASDVSHHRNSNWHKEIWAGDGQADAHLQYDTAYFVATGAIPTIDHSLGITEKSLSDTLAAFQAADNDILGSSLVKQHMPGTGARPDVGPLTAWATNYFVSQDAGALEVMLGQADAAGSIPWHFQDVETGEWVDIDNHPLVRTGSKGTTAAHGDDALSGWDADSGGWTPDTAHQPSLMFLPYLVTGSQYYANELAAQAAFSLTIYTLGRDGSTGLLFEHEIRGMAWALRALSEAAYALPDDHALKDYFAAKLNNNLDYLKTIYIEEGRMDAAGDVEGWFHHRQTDSKGYVSGWQQDFLSISLALAHQRGFETAGELLAWAENYITGRFLNAESGLDPIYGSTHRLWLMDTETKEYYSTWEQVVEATLELSTLNSSQLLGYPDNAASYVLKAQSAIAAHITVNASPDAMEAYGVISALSRDYGYWDIGSKANVHNNPYWLLAPILPDGTHLTQDRVIFGSGEFAGGEGSQMLIGNDGANVIHGGAGIDLVFGIGGDNVLYGGPGNDYIFGGPGNDRLVGGEGDDYLKGGSGSNTFVFDTDGTGRDVIADWDPGSDLLEIRQGINGMTESSGEDMLGRIFNDADGNAVLDLGAGNSVTLLGVVAADMTASHFALLME